MKTRNFGCAQLTRQISRAVGVLLISAVIPYATLAAGQTLETLHTFTASEGGLPLAGVAQDSKGALYGTAELGGNNSCGCGTVYKLTPPQAGQNWTASVLHDFSGSDGSGPNSNLLIDRSGALYSATGGGGSNNKGTIFRLSPPAPGQSEWKLTVLHNFQGQDGATPIGDLIAGADAIYGVTSGGGAAGAGTVYKLSPPSHGQQKWTETVLYNFNNVRDGSFPEAGVILDNSSALYGTTNLGGSHGFGTVYRLIPPQARHTQWTHTIIYNFQGGNDGSGPLASLTFDGKQTLYGTTIQGGTGGFGTAFRLTPPGRGQSAWTETILHNFALSDLAINPSAPVTLDSSGSLIGNSSSASSECGTVYKLTPQGTNWNLTILTDFSQPGAGCQPVGRLILDNAGNVYGVTELSPTVFAITP